MKVRGILIAAAATIFWGTAQAGEVNCQCPFSDEAKSSNAGCTVTSVEDACMIELQSFGKQAWDAGLARLESATGETLDAVFLPDGMSESAARQMAGDNAAQLVDTLFALSFVGANRTGGELDTESFLTLFNYLRGNARRTAEAFTGGEIIEYNRAVGYGVRKGCFHVRSQLTFGSFSFMYRTDWAEFEKPYTCVTSD